MISSATETKPANSNFQQFPSYLKGRSVVTGITPQFNINPRSVNSSKVIAKMSVFGRVFLRDQTCCVTSLSQCNKSNLISIEFAASLTADAITSVLELRSKCIWVQTSVFVKKSLERSCRSHVRTDLGGYLPLADSPESIVASDSVDNSVKYVWYLWTSRTWFFSHCFKHVCCSDNNFTSSVYLVMTIFW